MLSIFDDGSSLTTDSSGVVVSVTDSSGAGIPVASPGGGITQQFSNLVTYGVNALISRVAPAPAPLTGVQPRPMASQLSTLLASPAVRIGGLALLGFFLYKKFS